MSKPLTNVAHSAFDFPPPRSVAGGVPPLRRAHLRATANASAGIAPTAVANESMNRRLASWTTAAGSDSYFRLTEYAANRSASGCDMGYPVRRPWGAARLQLWAAGLL